ncbi:MAG: hypothetical protein KKF50_03535 [Nanoarchaeota archaeon]|nr:hypothetical protein [Nanoarchaeota archaeon]
MNQAVYCNGVKLEKQTFNLEEDFEREVKNNSKKLFGNKTIYLDTKKKIESISLGGSIPDGLLFDLEDPEDIKFYLVEVELAKHPFYEHIFPQITKFFAFYKNPVSQNNLIERIHSYITSNPEIKSEFEGLLNGQELYKSIKDAVENNQKILLIIDNEKPEIEEAQRVYTDTWDKLVIPEILSVYKKENKEVFILEPDFSEKELIIESEETQKEPEMRINYTENYHFNEINPSIVSLYQEIKEFVLNLNSQTEINPRKYYIVFRNNINFVYFYLKKGKIIMVPMVPFEEGEKIIKNHKFKSYKLGIQNWYNRPCFELTIENNENLDEIFELIKEAYKKQEG